MLSQRIVKLAIERAIHRTPHGDLTAQITLRESVERMSAVHHALLNGSSQFNLKPPPAAVRDIYTSPRWNLDAQVQSFLAHANHLAALPSGRVSLHDPDLVQIEEEARAPLLNALDAAVAANQDYSERAIDHLRAVLATLSALMLVILLAEALLLFRPLFNRLASQQQRLISLGRTDPLTGCFNRRAFEEFAAAAIDRARRAAEPLSLLSLDLDHFKKINDTHGHAAGDLVLRTFAAIVSQHIRGSDLLFRIGGEEFVLLLPRASFEHLDALAQRFRAAVAETVIPAPLAALRITVSLGGATLHATDLTLHHLLARADLALYQAKRAGRNCVELAPSPTGQPPISTCARPALLAPEQPSRGLLPARPCSSLQ